MTTEWPFLCIMAVLDLQILKVPTQLIQWNILSSILKLSIKKPKEVSMSKESDSLNNLPIPGSWVKGFAAAKIASAYSDGTLRAYRMGAAIFSSGKLLSSGYNLYSKTTPRGRVIKNGKEILLSLHCEMSCLTSIKYRDYDKNKLIIYVYRESAKGFPVSSKPCKECQKLLISSGVKIARYFNLDGEAEEMRLC